MYPVTKNSNSILEKVEGDSSYDDEDEVDPVAK